MVLKRVYFCCMQEGGRGVPLRGGGGGGAPAGGGGGGGGGGGAAFPGTGHAGEKGGGSFSDCSRFSLSLSLYTG